MKLTHNEIRDLIPRYRKKAQELYPKVSVDNWGNVQIGEDGAYVECHVWVGRDELESRKKENSDEND